MLKMKMMIWDFNFLNMKKILILMLIICPHLMWGQTISLQEYNDRCSRNDEAIKDVSTIEELFDYFNYGLGNNEKVLVVTDEINKIATYKTINRPNKARLYGFVFEYKSGTITHNTLNPEKDIERFMLLLRDNAFPNDIIVIGSLGEYYVGGCSASFMYGFDRKCFRIYPSARKLQ